LHGSLLRLKLHHAVLPLVPHGPPPVGRFTNGYSRDESRGADEWETNRISFLRFYVLDF
jgi:hypothetical protein